MATISPAQIARYAYNAGFRGVDLIRAVAIALAESGGNPRAYNPETAAGTRAGSGSRGLWQIYGTAHPEFNNDSVFDPQQNAIAAYKVYREAGNSFRPWSTWTQGVANRYISVAQGATSAASQNAQATTQAVAQMAGTIGQTTGAAVSSAAGGIFSGLDVGAVTTQIFTSLKNAILGKTAKGEQREGADLAFFIIGTVLVIIGLVFLFVNSEPGKRTVELVGEGAQTVAKGAVAAAL